MIPKPLNQITKEDILTLVNGNVKEYRTLEYKREFDIDGDKKKYEFLADVTALANVGGGDLIIGINEDTETETLSVHPIDSHNIEIIKEKINSWILHLIEPRIKVQFMEIKAAPRRLLKLK